MSTAIEKTDDNSVCVDVDELPGYRSLLLALDSSDHANHGVEAALALASMSAGAEITGVHVYAAKMHDLRFRQMEGGLPEQFREESELERQRDVHDNLIQRGLSIITDSYLDQAQSSCKKQDISFTGKSLEGKNYRALTRETNNGLYDLLVIGALGLGAIGGSRIGTVCSRVVRRADIDTLVIKNPSRDLRSGPIVVAIDGSTRAFGGLLTAMNLAQAWQVPLHVISSFDPYYHYVAFNRIAGVLSEEASKVFRFKEQEKLHEEIIDSGLAKIYEGHLTVAQSIADEHDIEIHTRLLDGKAHDAVERFVQEKDPSLLIIGKLGVHADSDLDIGGNAENLLRNVECSLLLSQREYQPRIDVLAESNTSWTREAEERLGKAPDFVQNMARVAILRYAQEQGHTVITERLVEEATSRLMPSRAEEMLEQIVAAYDDSGNNQLVTEQSMEWSPAARLILDSVDDESLRGNLKMRAEKKALAAGTFTVDRTHVQSFVKEAPPETEPLSPLSDTSLHWQAAALARLMKAPQGFMRDMSRKRIESFARENDLSVIDLDTAEAGLAAARQAMQDDLGREGKARLAAKANVGKCPFAGSVVAETVAQRVPEWSSDARKQLESVPVGYCRDMMITATESIASRQNLDEIDKAFVQTILRTFAAGSDSAGETLPWDDQARKRIASAPALVRGMLMKEIEGWAGRNGMTQVSEDAVDAVRQQWAERGVFHLDPNDPRSKKLMA